MEDHQIEAYILNLLKGTPYELLCFKRDQIFFGNMVTKIKTGNRVYTFIADRGDIFCDDRIVFTSAYHVAGEDDSPKYLIKAIEQLIK